LKTNILKVITVAVASIVFAVLLLLFCDFAGWMQDFPDLARIQFIPALLRGSIIAVVSLILMTFIFGRLYCSIICPFGILQDIISWFTRRGKKKNRRRLWFRYAKPQNILRYSILALCIISLLSGTTALISHLDPYSNFGRIATNLFRPVAVVLNNIVSNVGEKFHNYDIYHVTLHTHEIVSITFAASVLAAVAVMSLMRGRLFCNTICPVGSLLGLISKYSLFKITINQEHCTGCGLCEKACKAQCISSKNKHVDGSRCVACFNCLDRCRENGVKYRLSIPFHKVPAVARPSIADRAGRRDFLATGVAVAATLPFVHTLAANRHNGIIDETKLTPITPPGSISLEHFKKHCTACHLCITHCPQQILKPAKFNFGFSYLLKPHLVFYEMAYCNYGCTVCSEICPNGAIHRLTSEEKQVTQIGIAEFDQSRCVVFTDNTSCGACSEHCPTQAVHMVDYKDGLTIPHVLPEICIGCGACESICPVIPVKAINVRANEVHKIAEKPVDEEQKAVNQEDLDFGF
jgi:polyferredoxin